MNYNPFTMRPAESSIRRHIVVAAMNRVEHQGLFFIYEFRSGVLVQAIKLSPGTEPLDMATRDEVEELMMFNEKIPTAPIHLIPSVIALSTLDRTAARLPLTRLIITPCDGRPEPKPMAMALVHAVGVLLILDPTPEEVNALSLTPMEIEDSLRTAMIYYQWPWALPPGAEELFDRH